jgi:hypothetical protein
MIRIGVVNIDTSHPRAFCDILGKENRARYVAIYNDGFRGDDEVESFIKKYNLEKRCETIEELADMVDIGFVQGCNWDKHLEQAKVFIDKGKPVFLDKPVVGNMKECIELKKYSDKGAVILGGSSLRYSAAVSEIKKLEINELGKLINIFGTCGVDEFNYGTHIVETICSAVGSEAKWCKFNANSSVEGVSETYTVEFKSGATATYNIAHKTWHPCKLLVSTTKDVYYYNASSSDNYKAMLDRICDYMESGVNNMASVNELVDGIKIMLAGKLSRESGGKTILLEDLPLDYPGFDGREFEIGYASSASKSYLF